MKNDSCLRHEVWLLSFFFLLLPFSYEDLKYYSFYYGNAKNSFLESQIKRGKAHCVPGIMIQLLIQKMLY